METLLNKLGYVLLHAKPTPVFRQPVQSSYGTPIASLLHVSTNHLPYLNLPSSSWNPQRRALINREPEKTLGIQAHVTNVVMNDVAPDASAPRFARDACCASRITCLDGRVSSGALAAYTAVAPTLTEETVTHRESKSSKRLRSPAMCTIV